MKISSRLCTGFDLNFTRYQASKQASKASIIHVFFFFYFHNLASFWVRDTSLIRSMQLHGVITHGMHFLLL